MKKTIKILLEKMDKLQESKDGTLQGGFSSIRGGLNFNDSTNQSCTNVKDCSKSTNTGTPTCTNVQCFM
ncbi:hypothetical protein [Longitalea arenae]|uniref:hypothetical protein n=1 Tax=Longitalea arenae TaxID=2812558 RepID=UPI0019689D79|nr:hypothetical protein [Longitalea arenae]